MHTAPTTNQRRLISAALKDARRSGKVKRRHPAEVTSDRLGDTLDRWPDRFTGAEHDMIARIRFVLEQIAEGGEAS